MFEIPALAAGPLGEGGCDAEAVADGTDDADGTAADADPVADDAGDVPEQPVSATTMAMARTAARAAVCRGARPAKCPACPVTW
jgi:hypothetical protein